MAYPVDLEQFTAIAAHDRQEPLRVVTSYLSLLERHGAPLLDETLRSYLDYASDSAARMTRLRRKARLVSSPAHRPDSSSASHPSRRPAS